MVNLDEEDAAERRRLQPYFTAVGQLCNEWTSLEAEVNRLFGLIAKMPNEQASFTIISCIDFRDQLTGIKVGVLAHKMKPQFADAVIEAVDYIDNTLRNRRNRYVHDTWYSTPDPSQALKVQSAPKIIRPQARAPRKIIHSQVTGETLADLLATIEDIKDEARNLGGLCYEIEVPDAEPLPRLPSRRFLRPQQGKPRP